MENQSHKKFLLISAFTAGMTLTSTLLNALPSELREKTDSEVSALLRHKQTEIKVSEEKEKSKDKSTPVQYAVQIKTNINEEVDTKVENIVSNMRIIDSLDKDVTDKLTQIKELQQKEAEELEKVPSNDVEEPKKDNIVKKENEEILTEIEEPKEIENIESELSEMGGNREILPEELEGAIAIKEADFDDNTYLLLVNKDNIRLGWIDKDNVDVSVPEEKVIEEIIQKTQETVLLEPEITHPNPKEELKEKPVTVEEKKIENPKEDVLREDISSYAQILTTTGLYKDLELTEEIKLDREFTDLKEKITVGEKVIYLTSDDVYIEEKDISIFNPNKHLQVTANTVEEASKYSGKSVEELTKNTQGSTANDIPTTLFVVQKGKLDIDYDIRKQTKDKNKIATVEYLQQFSGIVKGEGLLPSVMLSQSLHESGNGTSKLYKDANNIFGIKGKYKQTYADNWETFEYTNQGQYYETSSNFRSYPSHLESVHDYIDFLKTNSRYKELFTKDNYKEATQQLYSSGYATDINYVSYLNKNIEELNLNELDKVEPLKVEDYLINKMSFKDKKIVETTDKEDSNKKEDSKKEDSKQKERKEKEENK